MSKNVSERLTWEEARLLRFPLRPAVGENEKKRKTRKGVSQPEELAMSLLPGASELCKGGAVEVCAVHSVNLIVNE